MFDLDPTDDAPRVVARLLAAARAARATDVHLQPESAGLRIAWRVDGVLHEVATLAGDLGTRIVTRTKVLADLLTYRTDLPQEGRIREAGDSEVRVSTFPTVFGERAVLRLFAAPERLRTLTDLGLPDDVRNRVVGALAETGGAVLFTGPAGGGKTTTAYACLREIAGASPRRCIVAVEDPVESIVPGVAQSQLNEAAGFDYPLALESLLRQDPEVILVGEIRNAAVARIVVEASLTGHLVLSTFHAGSAAAAVRRLLDMGIEPYHLRSALRLVLNQHLLRALCACAEWNDSGDAVDPPVERFRSPRECETCAGTGYVGRVVAAEVLVPGDVATAAAILDDRELREIEAAAIVGGMTTRLDRATALATTGRTSPDEVRRTFGFRSRPGVVD